MRRQPVGFASAVILLVIIGTSALAPITAPYDPVESIPGSRLQAPSSAHWFGTDNASRDVLSRVIWGGRNSLLIGTAAVALGLLGATVLGVVSGYFGGWADLLIQRVTDAMMAIPGLLLVLVVVTILGTGRGPVLFAIAIGLVFPNSRTVRSAALAVRHAMYVEAARSIGANPLRIIVRHVLPNITAPLIIIATVSIGAAITIEASLSFLGLGVPPPEPTWGQMLGGRTRVFMLDAPWMALAPGLALTAVVFSFNMLGDALRDVLDPRLRL
jgi:peptide/nickel transport system permease protein